MPSRRSRVRNSLPAPTSLHTGSVAEWFIAADLKSAERLASFHEFESHYFRHIPAQAGNLSPCAANIPPPGPAGGMVTHWIANPEHAGSSPAPASTYFAFVAQPDRASESDSEGHRFKSCREHHNHRMSGRVVECTVLERRQRGDPSFASSNLASSAKQQYLTPPYILETDIFT